MNYIQSLKKETFADAVESSISIVDSEGRVIGKLVPIGNWALDNESLLTSFANWRQTFMRFFFTQFCASVDSTIGYIKNHSIKKSDRIFFGIYVDDELSGHIGLSNVGEIKAELDNIIRGKSGGHRDLMYFAEKALLAWAFEKLKVKTIVAQVMSKNFMALSLHERFGFELKERHHLKKVVSENSTTFIRCKDTEATERFYLDIIELHLTSFLALKKSKERTAVD